MALHKIHEGSFYSRAGIEWIVQIFRNQSSAPSSVGELTFPDSSPLVIEWKETSKEDVICESSATLKIISPGDRTYIDLYAEGPTDVMLKVFRNDTSHLYWCGFLDPEFYEEPYSTYNNYEVSFTFSDFGVLKRIPFSGTGMYTLAEIFERSAGIILQDYTVNLSTYLNGNIVQLSSIKVYAENFFDEDGIAMSQYDVLEGVLRPLAARLIQRNGQFEIYDINKLFLDSQTNNIVWGSDDQVLGMDKVVNNIKATLSCYDSAVKSGEFKYIESNNDPYKSFLVDYEEHRGERPADYLSFKILYNDSATGVQSKDSQAKYFKIKPVLGGDESEGIVEHFYFGEMDFGATLLDGNHRIGVNAGRRIDSLFVMKPLRISSVPNAGKYRLRILHSILFDGRYNPYTDAGQYNGPNGVSQISFVHILRLPVKIELLNLAGTAVLKHYKNKNILDLTTATSFNALMGTWESGADPGDDCIISWYKEDASEAIGGWIGNRQTCPDSSVASLSAAVKAARDGQYIPYPPEAGLLRITVSNKCIEISEQVSIHPRWWLHKLPEISIVKSDLTASDIDSEDVEYSGIANVSAKDDLDIDLICGTMADPSPTARGLLLNSSGLPITSMTRQLRTDTAEQLLIGTLYSQFASRKITLSGTAMANGGLKLQYTDAALSNKMLMMLAASEECKEDEIYLKVAEFSQDNYTRQS